MHPTLRSGARHLAAAFFVAFLAACGGGYSGKPPPEIQTHPQSQEVEAGQLVTLGVGLRAASVADFTDVTYQWKRDGVAVPGAVESGYTLAAATLADSGSSWSVDVSRGGTTFTSHAAVLTVRPRPVATGELTLADFKDTRSSHLAAVYPLGVDPAGNIFLATTGEPYQSGTQTLYSETTTIAKFSPDGQALPAGPGGTAGITVGENITAAAVDPAGNLFIALTRFDPFTGLAASAEMPKLATNFRGPPRSSRVYRITPSGTMTLVIDARRGDAGFVAPVSLASNATDTLYIGDAAGNKLLRRAPDGTTANLGTASFADSRESIQVAVNRTGTVYLTYKYARAITQIKPDGSAGLLAGGAGSGTVRMDGTGSAAAFSQPEWTVVDPAGRLLLVDKTAIRKVTPDGVVSTVLEAPGSGGASYVASFSHLLGNAGGTYVDWGGLIFKVRPK